MKLPKLLAGPIIRRVEPAQAFIWVAMSDYYRIEADIYEVKRTSFQYKYNYLPLSVQSKTQTIRLGKNLYGYLVQITPNNGQFPKDVLLGYNLHFSSSSEELDLGSFNLLSKSNPFSIVYDELKYPTFFISDNNDKKLFGSCRKLHGKGEDALAGGDIKIRETYFDMKERPGALFLTGDQIYADDVADPIFPYIQYLSEELVGTDEDLAQVDKRLEAEHFQKALTQVHGRQFIIEKFCKFTSNNGHNHLMTFGEFAAMYLLSYSPELWKLANEEQFIHPFDELVKEKNYYFIFPNEMGYEDDFTREFFKCKTDYREQQEDLQQFQQTMPLVRRLLANVPTYMIFDDHDITDDWNISLEWKENVDNSPLARHVIANGLMAYWAFQGWGNNPVQYDYSFLIHTQRYIENNDFSSPSYHSWQSAILQYDKWSFVAPTNPKALFLDTRTNRAFDILPKPTQTGKIIKETTTGPQLISKKGWDIVSAQLEESGWKSGTPLILVSPSPFYGIRLIESFLFQYVLPLKLIRLPVQTAFDLELWRFNGRGYHEFHHRVEEWNPSTCIILSGDAHMASSVETDVTFNGQVRKLHQFTSSPMKNDSFSMLTEMLLKGILRLYALTTGKNELHRSCDSTFTLTSGKRSASNDACIWKEFIHYLTLPNGSIIETDNNLGLLSTEKDGINVQLLQYGNSEMEERSFEK
jgi:hypothetical protein